MGSFLHHGEDAKYELDWNAFVKEVTHAVYKHCPRLVPVKGLVYAFLPQAQVKPLFVGMAGGSTESFCQPEGVAVFAAFGDLVTACDRVPSHIRPLNCSSAHVPARQPNLGFGK